MSYILEALKKAEAERQLGSAPTIHASPAAHGAPNAAARSRKPLVIGLAAGVLLASAAALVTWRHQTAPAAPAVLAPATPGTDAAQVAAPEAVRAPAPGRAPALEPAPAVAAALAAAAGLAAAAAPAPVLAPGARAARAGAPAPAHANPPARAAGAAATPPASGADDNVRPLAELPEAIQLEVPKVAFGGYIYSPNPADRLLLVDKALRHEGEEVAPGLVLEKLLPKAAVMNYRGYRYRVAY